MLRYHSNRRPTHTDPQYPVMAKILIVDDSEAQLYALAKLVTDEGHIVITARDGEECIEKARNETPDLILMDVVMPGMNGFQVTRKMAKEEPTTEIPVVFVTTRDQESDRVWGMRQGASAYLTKPVDRKQLIATIDKVLNEQYEQPH